MASMESVVLELTQAGIATELLCAKAGDGTEFYGVRLRPFGRGLPRNKMIIAAGTTFEEGLINALAKAEDRRWESLDWAARPWERVAPARGASAFGLDDASGPQSRESWSIGQRDGFRP